MVVFWKYFLSYPGFSKIKFYTWDIEGDLCPAPAVFIAAFYEKTIISHNQNDRAVIVPLASYRSFVRNNGLQVDWLPT
jgi:hypothetical protein